MNGDAEVDKVAEVQHVQLRLDGRVFKIPENISTLFVKANLNDFLIYFILLSLHLQIEFLAAPMIANNAKRG